MGLFDRADHVLKVIGEQGGGKTEYRFEATAQVYDEQLDGADEIGDDYVQGAVNGGTDIIGFDGWPRGIAFGPNIGDYRLELDGERVWPFHLQMRELRIEGNADPTPYAFTVSNSGKILGSGSTTGEDHRLSDTEARGRVNDGGTDVWRFYGVLQGIDSNREGKDSLDVFVDDEPKPFQGNAPNGIVSYDG